MGPFDLLQVPVLELIRMGCTSEQIRILINLARRFRRARL